MTNGKDNRIKKESPFIGHMDFICGDTQQERFMVVLIDLQEAAKGNLFCIKMTLTKDLKYVALSYRWGELQETNIDTEVGYLASITSFDLQDFYVLCKDIVNEPTMASIPYVWVDAICVNQSDLDERKSTIYHMTEIYERATWILAVPDLHAAHLKIMHEREMAYIYQYHVYLYHLLHGNTKELQKMDVAFLNDICVPQDPALRELLVNYTHCFADGFMTVLRHSRFYNDVRLLAHLHENHHIEKKHSKVEPLPVLMNMDDYRTGNRLHSLHQCGDGVECPFNCHNFESSQQPKTNGWHVDIMERSTRIRQAMHFLTDLVVDWSSRVWVISEFYISKKINNLKLWFTQLSPFDDEPNVAFLKFDLNKPPLEVALYFKQFRVPYDPFSTPKDAVYITFYKQLINQLNRQTFLEIMLKSKASKNEDRFYAIFPLFPEYKPLLRNKELTNVTSILSVKLKLYQVMTVEHKVWLLHLSSSGNTTWTLPTFATPVIDWPYPEYYDSSGAWGISKMDGITLFYTDGLYYLRLKPTCYRISRSVFYTDSATTRLTQLLYPKTLPQMDDGLPRVDVILLFGFRKVALVGNFDENIWILGKRSYFNNDDNNDHFEDVDDIPDDFAGFHLY